jgi:hypothetical protein
VLTIAAKEIFMVSPNPSVVVAVSDPTEDDTETPELAPTVAAPAKDPDGDDADEGKSDTFLIAPATVEGVRKTIQRRVRWHQMTAAALMLAALGAIAVGIDLIYIAGDLANKSKATELGEIIKGLSNIADKRNEVIGKTQNDISRLDQLDSQLQFQKQMLADHKSDKKNSFNYPIAMDEERVRDLTVQIQTRDKAKANLAARQEQELQSLGESEKRLSENLASSSKALEYNSLIIRVAAVLLIIFLVQTFITVFRYLTRLAAYYQGRVDSLQLAVDRGISIADLRELSSIFSPETYDFGKTPKSPSDQALDLAKAIITSVRKEKK